MKDEEEQLLKELADRQQFVPAPKRIDRVVSELLTRKGYARVFTAASLLDAWRESLPASLVKLTRPGKMTARVLEVIVDNSTALQELMFIKQQVLQELNQRLDGQQVNDLRVRVMRLADN